MAGANHHRCIKLVLVGDIYVGKTSISRRFIDDIFHDKYQASVGGLFQAKTLREPNVTVQLWDTAGTEKFRALLPHFMRDAMCAILVYDISSRDSFENIKSYWLDFVELNAIPNMVKFLVGNKADVETRAVSDSEGRRFAKNRNMLFMETSAKVGVNVETLFIEAAKAVVKAIPESQVVNGGIRLEDYRKNHKRHCCSSRS
ncbi:unnamed protein product [Lymnaea stagnalis]|uniref:Uncharacterized protein n=1 Tax=Lymnaea stagnalis TaxID=6523 RepID=A0AAV2I6I0_LYMST